jgi:hypothetical protein
MDLSHRQLDTGDSWSSGYLLGRKGRRASAHKRRETITQEKGDDHRRSGIRINCSIGRCHVWTVNMAIPTQQTSFKEWWQVVGSQGQRIEGKKFDILFMLICWSLWKQRNARAFGNINRQSWIAMFGRRTTTICLQ